MNLSLTHSLKTRLELLTQPPFFFLSLSLYLENEINILKSLKHPNIVRYLGSSHEEDKVNIYMVSTLFSSDER